MWLIFEFYLSPDIDNITQLCYDQHSPEEVARQILKAACKFYDADWCGLIQVDLDLKIWTPFWWYNDSSEDKTTILTEEFESAEFLDRWVQAVRHGQPMIVPDAEEVKNTCPAEYDLYQRLGIKSVLGASLEPRPVALLAVRNPKRYISETSILRLLAYVLLVAYKDKKMNDGLNMAFAPENIESCHSSFCQPLWRTEDLHLPRHPARSRSEIPKNQPLTNLSFDFR